MGYISATKRKSILDIKKKKQNHDKISMLTCYDYTMAKIIDGAQIDILLVGDSASNVFSGNTDTLPISLDEIIYHAKAVVKGSSQALVVVDMPFGSYQVSEGKTLEAAIRIMKETGANAIKLEGGAEYASVIKKLVLCWSIVPYCWMVVPTDTIKNKGICNDQFQYCSKSSQHQFVKVDQLPQGCAADVGG